MTARKPLNPKSMGRLGGLARAKKLTKAQRVAIARLGGLGKHKQRGKP